jgi:hypothetical protein
LVRDVHRPGPQYLACSIRKAKHTHLEYRTKLSRLCSLDLPLAPVVPKGGHLVERTPKQKLDHRPPGRMQVPQASSTRDKIAQHNPVTAHEEIEPATQGGKLIEKTQNGSTIL